MFFKLVPRDWNFIQTIHNTLVIQGGIMKKIFFVFALLLMAGLVFAQTPFTATYTFGNDGNVASFAYNGTSYPGFAMGNIDKVGVTSTSSNGNFRANNWPLDTVGGVDTGKYIGFTISAEPGYVFTVTSITFGIGRSAAGTRNTQWRGSADSYAALINNYTSINPGLTNTNGVLENPDSNGNWTGNVLSLGASYQNISTSCGFRIYLYNSEVTSGTAGLQGTISISGTYESTSAQPSITVNPSSLSGFSYVEGSGPSTTQTFTVSGSNLTANISVSAPTNYEISFTSGSGYTSPLTLTQSGGTVAATTIYARLKAGLAVGNYNSENITASSTGADDKTVTCSGSVTSPPPPVAPLATAATNVGNNSFTANWNSVSGATGYSIDVYTGTYTELINTSFEGSTQFPSGWTQYSSYVQNNSAGAYTGTNYAGMNAANDYFYTPALSSPTTISFWTLASSATANNTTIVQYSSDANTWIDLATYSADGADTGDITTTFSQKVINANLTGSYYIRWFMSHRSGGSAYFDDVLIVSGSNTYVIQNLNVSNVTSHNVTGLTPGTTYYYVVRAYNSYGTSDDSNVIEVTTTSTSPLITLSTASLSGFSYVEGEGPSAEQSFTVSGNNLTADIDISAPSNYEIALVSGGPFSSSIELTENNGVVEDTDIYVRLKAGLAVGTYNGEIIEISSDDADSKIVTCNGEVIAPPPAEKDLIHYWNFNDDTPADDSTNWDDPIDATIGSGYLEYEFSEAYSFGGTTINGIGDEENGGSFSPRGGPNNENNGEYFDLIAPTTGYNNIVMTYPTRRTSTGFSTQTIYYTANGVDWIFKETLDISSYENNWKASQLITVDFSGIPEASNNALFAIRIYLDGAASASGNNRFDNIRIMGERTNPVELSSFTATISAQNYITLTWVTQTETGMRGYYVYRAPINDLASAQIVSPMIASVNSSQQQTYIYQDTELYDSGIYYYWLQANDLDGSSAFHGPVSVVYSATGDNPTPEIPLVTKLHSAYPNPFNPTVFIPFSLAEDGAVSFKIYNSRGQMVKHFDLGAKIAGHHRITWDGTDYDGKALANGVYQIMMSTKNQTYQSKATLLK